MLPDLELVVGPQAPVAELPPVEAQNRFNLVFESFVRTCASDRHPLTIFLDDLQWADAPTLRLLKQIPSHPEASHILLIGAYRDNEVDPTHPFMLTVGEIEDEGAKLETLTLAPLGEADIGQLVADTLRRTPSEVADLTRICLAKTGGNPFFLNQFLRALYEEEAIDFDRATGRWGWDVERIAATGITDNVVDLMARKLRTLPADTQQALQLAACIGASFGLHTLAIVHTESPVTTQKHLWAGLDAGLVVPVGDQYKFVVEEGAPAGRIEYRWLHDRVQQAAYSLIDEDRRAGVHQAVGRLMLENLSESERGDKLFEIVGHLNLAADTLTDGAKRVELAALNLEVGRKGMSSAAYQPASGFLARGVSLLPDDAWSRHAELTKALHEDAAKAFLLVPDFEAMARHIDEVLAHTRDVSEKVKVYEIRILACLAQAKVAEGVETALEILGLLGVHFPKDPTPEHVGEYLGKVAAAIGDREIEDLLHIPENPDPNEVAAIRLLVNITSTAYIGAPALFPLIVLEAVALSAANGDTGATAYAYVTYGIILCGVLEQFDAGIRFGELGQKIVEKYDAREYAARPRYIPNCFLLFWKSHLSVPVESHPATYQLGLETGDQEFAAWPLMKRTQQAFFMGLPLAERVEEARHYVDACLQLKQDPSGRYAQETLQAMLGLMGETDDPLLIRGAEFDEFEFLPKFVDGSEAFGICNHYVTKIMLAYLFDQPERVPELAAALGPWAPAMVSLYHVPVFHLYYALSLLALACDVDPETRAGMLELADASMARLAVYADACPENFAHKHALVAGARARLLGDSEAARAHFREASEGARRNGYLQEEGLASELLGKLWISLGETEVGGLFLSRARHAYSLWGADAKVSQLDIVYGEVLGAQWRAGGQQGTTFSGIVTVSDATGSATGGILDMASVLKANQALSGEVVLSKLLARVMTIVLENGGARRGMLLPAEDGVLQVEARAGVDQETIVETMSLSDAIEGTLLPATIVNYVARATTAVVLDNAQEADLYSGDRYIRETGALSILCEPLLHQGKLVGILYLENDAVAGAFTEARLEVLSLICGQATVSLENAHLFEHQRRVNESFARFVPQEFLNRLGKSRIIDIELGDSVVQDCTVMFTDLRGFTTMSESMTAEENFAFLNSYTMAMEPLIEANGGFIDKFIGDAIMSLFPHGPEHALKAAIDMQAALDGVNVERVGAGQAPLRMGSGVHTGRLMMGTIGSPARMETTVIGNTVSMASRLEGLTKHYGSLILISGACRDLLPDPDAYSVRRVGRVLVKGLTVPSDVYEVLGPEPEQLRASKLATLDAFRRSMAAFGDRDLDAARAGFASVVSTAPDDVAAQLWLRRALAARAGDSVEAWTEVETMSHK